MTRTAFLGRSRWRVFTAEGTSMSGIPTPAVSFEVRPFSGRWFHWTEINSCFWPGRGRRADRVNPELAPVRWLGGDYALAWCPDPPVLVHPAAPEVRYIGETACFRV